jgi:hypothetical protein
MQAKATGLSAREILKREYGSSRNLLTPNVITRGKLDRDTACELSWGHGMEPGSHLYGVTVVRVTSVTDGTHVTERDYDASCCFSSLQAANEHIASLRAIEGRRAA